MIQKKEPFTLVIQRAPVPPDFFPAIDPPSATVLQGGVATYLVSFAVAGGYVNPIGLAVLGLPEGAAASFDINPAMPADVVTLTIETGSAAADVYPCEVQATEVEVTG